MLEIFACMFISFPLAHTKSFMINPYVEEFLEFNLCFCSKEIVKNNLWLEKY
jgi:hypothetical protein